jgi:signal transduction histidine kinase
VPVAEDDILIVDGESSTVLETLPFPEHKSGPRINGDALHNTYSPGQRTQALIERQVRRMTQLVDDLLDVSRISHGRLHLQRERRGKKDCGESRHRAGK